jgi:hypothetical protein
MRPSCSKEDRISSFRLQESQSPPEVSGMADSVSEDHAEPLAASDLEAWRGDSGSMAASGVAVITSRTSNEDEEDDASLWRKRYQRRGFPRCLVGDGEALVVALRRENATGANEG